jgi:Hemerythrin HHE cation binding domain
MDITDLILTQHGEQRRMFALIDDIDPTDTPTLEAVWSRLAVLLEVHARAEEKFFYPRLLAIGTGAADADDAAAETKDAIKDHNQIRDAVRRAADHPTGTDAWWKAVIDARIANSDHMAEEERQDLADFRRRADLQTRHDIAVAFLTYEARHYAGIRAHDEDPQAWIDAHR